MTRNTNNNDNSRALEPDLQQLLNEIEKEPVPERLLDLARELQAALVRLRRDSR